jgi:hypothetical protein
MVVGQRVSIEQDGRPLPTSNQVLTSAGLGWIYKVLEANVLVKNPELFIVQEVAALVRVSFLGTDPAPRLGIADGYSGRHARSPAPVAQANAPKRREEKYETDQHFNRSLAGWGPDYDVRPDRMHRKGNHQGSA